MRGMAICAAATMLAACGGGSNSSDDPLFDNFSSIQNGGFRDTATQVLPPPASNSSACIFDPPSPSRDSARTLVSNAGGAVTVDNSARFCAEIPGRQECFVAVGDSVVDDFTADGSHEVDLFIVGGLAGHFAKLAYHLNATPPAADFSANAADATIFPTDNTLVCPENPSHVSTDINGNWSGSDVVYDPDAVSGVSAPSTMTCTAQTCVVVGAISFTVNLTEFDSKGVWNGATDTLSIAATIAADNQFAGVYACTAPIDTTAILADCHFYGFAKR